MEGTSIRVLVGVVGHANDGWLDVGVGDESEVGGGGERVVEEVEGVGGADEEVEEDGEEVEELNIHAGDLFAGEFRRQNELHLKGLVEYSNRIVIHIFSELNSKREPCLHEIISKCFGGGVMVDYYYSSVVDRIFCVFFFFFLSKKTYF